MPAVPTAELTARIARGDAAAASAFYEAWFDGAYGLARTVSRRGEDFCLDVVQDVMLKVVDRLPVLATESAVAAWMSKAVVRAIVDRQRAEQRRRTREERAAAEDGAGEAPLEALLLGEARGWLSAQLAGLPAADRELLLERFAGEQTLAAVGQRFGLNEDQAHGRLRRALSRLRAAAKEWFGER